MCRCVTCFLRASPASAIELGRKWSNRARVPVYLNALEQKAPTWSQSDLALGLAPEGRHQRAHLQLGQLGGLTVAVR